MRVLSHTPTMEEILNALVVGLALTLRHAPATPETVAPDSPCAAFLASSRAASSERWDDRHAGQFAS